VILLRRPIERTVAMVTGDSSGRQLDLYFGEITANLAAKVFEYAVLVTSLPDEVLTVAQLYRDRATGENNFDELKNHWGWGGFTTRDLQRCRLMARIVALARISHKI
jgi:Transposase DDE domain